MTDEPRRTFWRDHIEAFATAIVLALAFKGFILDAFRIPSGSMQPTLFGEERMGVHDRILVDRLSYLVSDPQRFDVVVFRFPLDRSRNFVKRVVGIGPEEIRLRGGDLFRRADASQPWAIVRKPASVQASLLRALDAEANDPAAPEDTLFGDLSEDWQARGREVLASGGGGRARYRPDQGTIRDATLDGYPDPIATFLEDRVHEFETNLIADLRLTGDVSMASAASVWFELTEGRTTFRFEVLASGRARITARSMDANKLPLELATAELDEALNAPFELLAQNIDDLLSLSIDGRLILTTEIEASDDQRAELWIGSSGSPEPDAQGARFTELHVWRDIYYSAARASTSLVTIPADHYYVLGDNTTDSADSREWRFTRFQVKSADGTDGELLRGNTRRGENPLTVGIGSLPEPQYRFTDEWGEVHWLKQSEALRVPPEEAPFVPRQAIVGRAWAVFWPWMPRHDLVRMRWIR